MTEERPRQRYNSVSQREMVKDNRTYLIQAILDPVKTQQIYERFYPEHYEILVHQLAEKKLVRKALANDTAIRQYIRHLTKTRGFIRHNSRDVFRQYLLSLDLKMTLDRRNVR